MNELFLDIETIPTSDEELIAEIRERHQVPPLDLLSIQAAGNIKDPDKIAADIEKKRAKAIADHEAAVAGVDAAIDEAIRKTALDTSVAQIVCIAWGWDDEPVQSVQGLDEADLLRRFWKALQVVDGAKHEVSGRVQRPFTPTVIAHHSEFDIRGLWRRSIVNKVATPAWWPVDARPWDASRIRDTQAMWMGPKGFISLDRLCKLLGIAGKGEIDGSMVWDLVREGRLDDAAGYCRDNVGARLRPVYRRLQNASEFIEEEALKRKLAGLAAMSKPALDDFIPDFPATV